MKPIILLILSLYISNSWAQEHKSIHQIQSEYYSPYNYPKESDWNASAPPTYHPKKSGKEKILNKITYGWNPYWMGTSYYNYDYNLLSDVAYFSYEVNAVTGEPDDIHYWKTTHIVDSAHHYGSRIHLTATLFSNHETFFGNPAAVTTMIDSIVSLVAYRNADGINIDFEMVPGSQRDALTNFMQDLSTALAAYSPDAQLSIALPAVDWSNSFDVSALASYTDYFIIMGYEYHWSESAYAGPGAPKNNGDLWSAIDLTRSVNTYLENEIPAEQLVLGLPYYGRDWPVSGNVVPALNEGTGNSIIYSDIIINFSGNEKQWDSHSSSSYYAYTDGSQHRQCWFNDAESLGLIYDMVKMKNIGGIGIWALGYDGANDELWNLLDEKFTHTANIRESGQFSDMGGPEGNYFDNESYEFTIHPPEAETIYLQFEYSEIEQGYDTLFIYNGIADDEHLLAELTGNNSPGQLTVPGNKALFYFKSDGATTDEGWVLEWRTNNTIHVPLVNEERQPNIKVFPNPFSNELSFEIRTAKKETVNIRITNSKGQPVYEKSEQLFPGQQTYNLNFMKHSLPDGLYIMELISGKEQISKKSIKICKETKF
ncbi:MAG: glycosyl hydrolase family 18 protein [Bacteroidota bacterium]|nr:glycosyl hydrolase family 18 protein [Bacteroidota bacterium]